MTEQWTPKTLHLEIPPELSPPFTSSSSSWEKISPSSYTAENTPISDVLSSLSRVLLSLTAKKQAALHPSLMSPDIKTKSSAAISQK